MTPRFTRTVLLVSVLSLVVVPTGSTQAQTGLAELSMRVFAGQMFSCTIATTRLPDGEIRITTVHERCVGGTFSSIGTVSVEATRENAERAATCNATPAAGTVIPFSVRDTTLEGRGRIGETNISVGTGTVTHAGGMGTGPCSVRLTGAFHRVGSVYSGRMVVGVIVDTGNPTRDFTHLYCARFAIHAIPDPMMTGDTFVTAQAEGRQPCRVDEVRDADGTHGRVAADNVVLEHDAFHH